MKFFATFGTDPAYPFLHTDYVLIIAENETMARQIFNEVHPNIRDCCNPNFAFMYSERQWERMNIHARIYKNKNPAEIIYQKDL